MEAGKILNEIFLSQDGINLTWWKAISFTKQLSFRDMFYDFNWKMNKGALKLCSKPFGVQGYEGKYYHIWIRFIAVIHSTLAINKAKYYSPLLKIYKIRGSCPEMFLGKGVPKICNKFIGEQPMPKCDFNKVVLKSHFSVGFLL